MKSVVQGKEACMREADIASEEADKWVDPDNCARLDSDERASAALVSIAHSARELCWLTRVSMAQSLETPKVPTTGVLFSDTELLALRLIVGQHPVEELESQLGPKTQELLRKLGFVVAS